VTTPPGNSRNELGGTVSTVMTDPDASPNSEPSSSVQGHRCSGTPGEATYR
jgi:hypothetical protein